MRIAVAGPPGSGKSVLARLLCRLIPGLERIRGDDYIHETWEDDASLLQRLATVDNYVFDHVSASRIILNRGLQADFFVFLTPSTGDLIARRPHLYLTDDAANFAVQSARIESRRVHNAGLRIIMGSDIRSLMPGLLSLLREQGCLPPKITSLILKIASRCNIDCSYCYMYHSYDHEWRKNPVAMSPSVAQAISRRAREHAELHGLANMTIVLHGGEPLSLKVEQFRSTVSAMLKELGTGVQWDIGVQTNGTLVTDEYLQCIDELGLGIGISLDGGSTANSDRLDFGGRSTLEAALAGLRKCQAYSFKRGMFGGVLAVVNPGASGEKVYHFLRSAGVKRIDFLLRDRTHDTAVAPGIAAGEKDFLLAAFDSWLNDSEECRVSYFESIVATLLGQHWGTDSLGVYPPSFLGISTDGSWELLDSLRLCFPGAWKTPYNVFDHSIDLVRNSPEYEQLIAWKYDLADQCFECPYVTTCGGGYLPHRYRNSVGSLFQNPSVHCSTILSLIQRADASLMQQLPGYTRQA